MCSFATAIFTPKFLYFCCNCKNRSLRQSHKFHSITKQHYNITFTIPITVPVPDQRPDPPDHPLLTTYMLKLKRSFASMYINNGRNSGQTSDGPVVSSPQQLQLPPCGSTFGVGMSYNEASEPCPPSVEAHQA